jgi:predicted membrane-bound spermidine synthase
MQSLINTFKQNPQKLFLADGLGAVLTALLLAFVLAPFENIFGMPSNIIYILAAVACVLIIYSFSCYFIKPKNPKPYIQIVALANFLYCITTIILSLNYYNHLTIWGSLYFGGELLVLALIIYIEIQVSSSIVYTSN